jgi:hypothetical protein
MSDLSKPSIALPRSDSDSRLFPGCGFLFPVYARENSRFGRIGKRGRKQLKRNRLLRMSEIDFGACGDFFPVFPGEPEKFGQAGVTG